MIYPAVRVTAEWLLVLNLAALALSGFLTLSSWRLMDALALSLLLEAGILLTAGGAMDLSNSIFLTEARKRLFGSKEEYSSVRHREAQNKGRRLFALGAAALVESVIISLL